MRERYNDNEMGDQAANKQQFVIGLTGNIGSGKSTILNMLRHVGVYGIDADDLTKRAYDQQHIVDAVRDRFGDINRQELAKIVFNDKAALKDLEAIIHPAVTHAAKTLLENATLPIIAIEAIKLLESDLVDVCDSIWVVDANQQAILQRLQKSRGLQPDQIQQRLSNQSSIEEKRRKADFIIENSTSHHAAWHQVQHAWQTIKATTACKPLAEKTARLTAPFSHQIVTPFSETHERINNQLSRGISCHYLPNHEPVDQENIESAICEGIVFSTIEAPDAGLFTSWKPSTFNLRISVIYKLGDPATAQFPASFPTEIESFARLHRFASLHIPMPLPLISHIQATISDKQYTLLPEREALAAEWLKAGYNVLYKQLWNADQCFKH